MELAMKTLKPAYLIAGKKEKTITYAEEFLQQIFCSKNKKADCFCPDCRKIKQRQHHDLIWIAPEKDYTAEDVEIIFEKTRFTLDDNQTLFFVLEKAQTLNQTAANRILKVLEEPPLGYHFLLLTTNETGTLPTIRSRCVTVNLLNEQEEAINNSLTSFFLSQTKLSDPFAFEQALRNEKLADSESIQLVNELLCEFSRKMISIIKQKTPPSPHVEISYMEEVIDFLQNSLKKPPQSGSSMLFWKNLFLRFPRKY
jgi:hypothetical protein